ncbi:hypothetical protein [Burkholderia ubonensis]|uniref:hypothetical protein n=1 Tax=Burkholderia ubonensis TaxID=101571 RepID=UPI0012FB9E20|nr:hypothetical protein [Burkholderia ubonensis]
MIRQAMSKSATDFTNSPDLIVTGASAAFDTSAFIDPGAYHWYFSQAPVPGKANYVYIRGLNYTPTGTQNSRVYLYYAQSDQVLDPTKWKSTDFTVKNEKQNFTPINATAQYQYVIPPDPVMWSPPVPTTNGAFYYLITWVDNSANPSPPVFPSTPFSDLAAFNNYIQQYPQMAVLDTLYRGAFLRQYPGQTVADDGTGAQTSPDLVSNGVIAAQDASLFATTASYSATTLHNQAGLGARNFIYVRAINTRNGPGKSRVYLYWATTDSLSPPGWQAVNFSYAGSEQNWIDLAATRAGEVMVSTVPFVWNAASGLNYLLVAYVDNSDNPQPPDFTPFGYVTSNGVKDFVASQPQLAWVAIQGSAAQKPAMSWEVALNANQGGNFYAGVQLTNIPTDGTFSLSIPGPDAANTVVAQSVKVPDPNALVAWRTTYPASFATSAVLSYFQGATTPGSANITSVLISRG